MRAFPSVAPEPVGMLNIQSISRKQREFAITWSDGSQNQYPFIWLRDNDPHELHPHTGERIFDLTSVDLNIQPQAYALIVNGELAENSLNVSWPGKRDESSYSAKWLYLHRPGHRRPDPALIERESWVAAQMASIPRFPATGGASSADVLQNALVALKKKGIIIIDGLADDVSAGEHFGDLIGFKRESNYGVMFEVKSKPKPNNLAYTSLALPLHTDLANQESVPGFQFLHCYRNNAIGGGSIFADGLAIVEDFKQDCPGHYKLLCELQVPWHFLDIETDLRQHRPVIGLSAGGQFKSLTFNAHLADVPDFEPGLMYEFYAAFQELMQRIRDPKYDIEYVLANGEMVVFDNLRILHGRTQFDPDSGDRHLLGYYIEHNEVENRIRMLEQSNHR